MTIEVTFDGVYLGIPLALDEEDDEEEAIVSVNDILEAFRLRIGEGEGVKMRAEESDKLDYIERYRSRGEEEGFRPDWPNFIALWNARNDNDDAMAELLAETLGVAHDEALAWIEDY